MNVMTAKHAYHRPGRFRLIWSRIVRVFSKDSGEFQLFAIVEQLETSCRELYEKAKGLISGQEDLRARLRERDGQVLAARLEILDLKRSLEIAEDANQLNQVRHTVLAPADLLPYETLMLPEYEEPDEPPAQEDGLDAKTLQNILVAEITQAIVPVETQGVLKIVPLGEVPVARTSSNWLDEEPLSASV
jgi:hypothetical protein